MIKFLKKHKLNFISYLFCAFAMALFTIISFSCKTYAYTIDNNGNLVGDNLYNGATYTDRYGNTGYEFTPVATDYYTLSIPQSVILISCDLKSDGSNVALSNANTNYLTVNLQNNTTYVFYVRNQNGWNGAGDYIQYVMINKGQEPEEWEPYGVWYSETNYDTLENQLNNTNGLLDLQIDITKYGWLSYIDNFDYYVTGNFVEDFTFDELKSNNYISSNATLDLYQISRYQNPNYSYIKFDIYFQNSYSNVDYFSANLFDLSTKLGFNGVLTIYDTDSNSVVFNITDIMSITYEDIISQNNNFGDYIYNVTFEFASPDSATMIYTNSFYSRGYQTGYSYGAGVTTGYYTPIINDLNGRISNFENDIVSLNNTIDTLKELNAQYQQQLADNVGWSSLFFAFADTPFKVVSNVLGFELFGLNLFATFIGMITVFGVVYLLKKFL